LYRTGVPTSAVCRTGVQQHCIEKYCSAASPVQDRSTRALHSTGIEQPFREQEYSSHALSSTAWNSALVQQPCTGQE